MKTGALILVIVGLITSVFWQQERIAKLRAEGAALREQVAQGVSLREENQQLTSLLKSKTDALEAERNELMSLRAQSSRLRQVEGENAQLKSEQQRLAGELSLAKDARVATAQQGMAPAKTNARVPVAEPKNFGVVELSEETPTRFDLGGGKECMATTTVLADGNLEVAFSSGSLVEGIPVETKRTSKLTPGVEVATVIDGVDVLFTPTLKTK